MQFDLLDAGFASEALGIQPSDFYFVVQRCGYLPAGKINGVEYYSRNAIDAARDYIERRKQEDERKKLSV